MENKTKYLIMHVVDNSLCGKEFGTINEAKKGIRELINNDRPLSLCIMKYYYKEIKDSNGVLVEKIGILNRAENCCYTNFNGVEVTNVIIRKPL